MSTDRGMDKEDVMHLYNVIFSAIKMNEIMPFVATWMNLEIITLREVSPTDKNIMVSLICRI